MRSTAVTIIGAVAIAAEAMDDMAAEDQAGTVPLFEVDPFWPKPLPNHWLIGPTIGVTVDDNDGVWIVQRNTPDQFVANTEIGLAQDPLRVLEQIEVAVRVDQS